MIRLFGLNLDEAKSTADRLLRVEGKKVAVYQVGPGFVILDEAATEGYEAASLKAWHIYDPERRAHERMSFHVPVTHIEVVESA